MGSVEASHPPEQVSESLLESLAGMVDHPRLQQQVRRLAEGASPMEVAWEAARLHRAEQLLLPGGGRPLDLEELRREALLRLPDHLALLLDELRVLELLAPEGSPVSTRVQELLSRVLGEVVRELPDWEAELESRLAEWT